MKDSPPCMESPSSVGSSRLKVTGGRGGGGRASTLLPSKFVSTFTFAVMSGVAATAVDRGASIFPVVAHAAGGALVHGGLADVLVGLRVALVGGPLFGGPLGGLFLSALLLGLPLFLSPLPAPLPRGPVPPAARCSSVRGRVVVRIARVIRIIVLVRDPLIELALFGLRAVGFDLFEGLDLLSLALGFLVTEFTLFLRWRRKSTSDCPPDLSPASPSEDPPPSSPSPSPPSPPPPPPKNSSKRPLTYPEKLTAYGLYKSTSPPTPPFTSGSAWPLGSVPGRGAVVGVGVQVRVDRQRRGTVGGGVGVLELPRRRVVPAGPHHHRRSARPVRAVGVLALVAQVGVVARGGDQVPPRVVRVRARGGGPGRGVVEEADHVAVLVGPVQARGRGVAGCSSDGTADRSRRGCRWWSRTRRTGRRWSRTGRCPGRRR